jgi:predicted N-formylglutamate amidohydrolase
MPPGPHSIEDLLTPEDPPAFECVNPQGRCDTVLICDHASNAIPLRLGTLGLAPKRLSEHIAWDLGAAALALALSNALDAPLLLSSYSRLVIDCNRPLESAESIPELSSGVEVPGNRALTLVQRRQRIDTLFAPYHGVIEALLDARADRPTALLSIHSFTQTLDGIERPWVIGVSSRQSRPFAKRLIQALRDGASGRVGDNQPYEIEDAFDYSLPTHGERRGIPHAMIEVRQDGLATPTGVDRWALQLQAAITQKGADA